MNPAAVLSRVVVGILSCAVLASAQLLVDSVQITGNQRIESPKIIAFTGLRPGATTSNPQLQKICQKLVDSGFFTSANFTYQPQKRGTGWTYQIAFAVVEDPTLIRASVDIDGAPEDTVWQQLAAVNPLLGPVMPDNDLAQAAYQRALDATFSTPAHAFRAEPRREADLKAHTMLVIFRDANAPKLTALQFEGNHAIDNETLEAALHGIVIGQPYSERELSTVVGLILVRLYERKGYLRAAFPKVARVNPGAPEAVARVTVEEGPCFKFGSLQIIGEKLPGPAMQKAAALHPGKPANWDEITVGAEMARRVLTSSGYLKASYQLQRVFPPGTETVDVQMFVDKGPQYMLGDLLFAGLDPDKQDLISRRFEIRSGAPVNEQYVYNFKSEIYSLAGRRVKTVDMQYVPHAGTANVYDVKYEIH